MDVELNLNSETISQAGFAEPYCVVPETLVGDVLAQMGQRNSGGVLVCRDDALLGIFTERDAIRLMATGADLNVPVEQVMVTPVVSVQADDTVAAAIRRMSAGHYRRLPVVDSQQRPVGMIKTSAILHYLVEHFPEAVYNLPPEPRAPQQREGP